MRTEQLSVAGISSAPDEKEFAVVKRSIVVDGHKTSVSLEDAFWRSLKDIAMRRGLTLSTQIAIIDQHRKTSNLSSAIRLFVLEHFRDRALNTVVIGERPYVSHGYVGSGT
jgi:predicted DNA-binding ribbon-helix-helix protein